METDTINNTSENGEQDEEQKIGKKALKKLKKEEGRKEYWQLKRAQEKEKRKAKKQKLQTEEPSKTFTPDPMKQEMRARKKRTEDEIEYKGTVVIDCGFDDDMSIKEIRSLGTQLSFCQGSNATAKYPVHLYCTSFGGKLEEQMQKHNGFSKWKIHCDKRSYLDIFDKNDLVYLTADSNETLKEINPKKVYIIGGLVDHNRLKGICYKKATTQGIATAQLPIGNYFKASTRKVLAVNHVLQILLHFIEKNNWLEAFEHAIPQRKISPPSGNVQTEDNENPKENECTE